MFVHGSVDPRLSRPALDHTFGSVAAGRRRSLAAADEREPLRWRYWSSLGDDGIGTALAKMGSDFTIHVSPASHSGQLLWREWEMARVRAALPYASRLITTTFGSLPVNRRSSVSSASRVAGR